MREIIRIQGVSDTQRATSLRFEGLSFEVTDYTNRLPEDEWESNSGYGAVAFKYADHCELKHIRVRNTGFKGVLIGPYSSYISVSGSLIEHTGTDGIDIFGVAYKEVTHHNSISNCMVNYVGELKGRAKGIGLVYSPHNRISFCSTAYMTKARTTITSSTWTSVTRIGTVATRVDSTQIVRISRNYFEQIVTHHNAHDPSDLDIAPTGIFIDDGSTNSRWRNVRSHANQNREQVRFNKGTLVATNVSWLKGFDESLMEYALIGVKADFPAEYGGGIPGASDVALDKPATASRTLNP